MQYNRDFIILYSHRMCLCDYVEHTSCCVLIADVRQQVSDILSLFTGTHNFHNFTSGKYAVILMSVFYMIRIVLCLQLASIATYSCLALVLFFLVCHLNVSFLT